MDIKQIIEDILKKINLDETFSKLFSSNPVKAVEEVAGIDLPDEQIQGIIEGVKAKLNVEEAGGIIDKVKGIFGK